MIGLFNGSPVSINNLNVFRVVVVIFALVSMTMVVFHAVSDSGKTNDDLTHVHEPGRIRESGNLTVVTTHFGDSKEGGIAAFNESGRLVYQNSTYTRYFDVDPVPNTSTTVMYVAEQNVPNSECGLRQSSDLVCLRQIIERLNLTTDSPTRVYSEIVLTAHSNDGWHDVDRISRDEYLIADIFEHRAFILNTSTGIVTWEWRAITDYSVQSGGGNKIDWTHLNDVELVKNNSVVMVDLRNHDQIAFVHRKTGLLENWTLGSDDTHSVLNEQHNPDFIPRGNGGPAVIVADSENNRVVEYQRRGGGWVRSWAWSDPGMEWPRDADRLPNGNTLISDTHANRIIEVDPTGDIVWLVDYPKPYEVERLGTGDESTNGESARRVGSTNRTVSSHLVPNKPKHGVLWIAPPWMTFLDIVLIITTIGLVFSLIIVELWRTTR